MKPIQEDRLHVFKRNYVLRNCDGKTSVMIPDFASDMDAWNDDSHVDNYFTGTIMELMPFDADQYSIEVLEPSTGRSLGTAKCDVPFITAKLREAGLHLAEMDVYSTEDELEWRKTNYENLWKEIGKPPADYEVEYDDIDDQIYYAEYDGVLWSLAKQVLEIIQQNENN